MERQIKVNNWRIIKIDELLQIKLHFSQEFCKKLKLPSKTLLGQLPIFLVFIFLGGFLLRKKQAIRGSAIAAFLRYASERLRRPCYPCHGKV